MHENTTIAPNPHADPSLAARAALQTTRERCAPPRYRYEFRRDADPLHPYEDSAEDGIAILCTMRNHDFGNLERKMTREDADQKFDGWKRFAIRGHLHGVLRITLADDPEQGPRYVCPWDSGIAGYVYVDPERIPDPLAAARCAIETLDLWINGDVWGLVQTEDGGDDDGGESHSLWGLYPEDGTPEGFPESVIHEYPEADHAKIRKAWSDRR